MDVLILILCLLVFTLGLALFSNQARSNQDIPFELKPNCLLTRFPLLFVTGPRSIFYFKSYWNIYTLFLAEHGYEVFTLHLPWNNPQQRQERFLYFLKQQETHNRHFHLVLDAVTFQEFEGVIRQHKSSAIMSLTEIVDPGLSLKSHHLSALPIPTAEVVCLPSQKNSLFLKFAYGLHQWLTKKKDLPSLSTLGANKDTAISNSLLLLERAQTLAEMDLREDRPL
ncbi:hypothetical protein [Bdellovibrio sp. BCCA]|uniref:hypothetical protein n=1 Tax=Bdellovibrio sp. BCCA TaxID=3136281 RepID=UPI0030F125A4